MEDDEEGRTLRVESAVAAQGGMTGDDASASAAVTGGFGTRLKRLGSESLVYGLSSIVGRLLSYLLQPYYAHQFDPAQNGVQSVVYSYIPIISIALYLGMDVAYMRNAAARARRVARASGSAPSRCRSRWCAFVGGAIAGAGCSPPRRGWRRSCGSTPARSAIMIAIVYTDALLAVPFAHLRMTQPLDALRGARGCSSSRVSVALNIVLIGQLHWGVSAIFVANLLAQRAACCRSSCPTSRGFFRPPLLRGAPWRPLWAYALPIMPAMLAVMLVENGDRIVLNYLPETVARGGLRHDVQGRRRHLQLQLQARRRDAARRADVPDGVDAVLAAARARSAARRSSSRACSRRSCWCARVVFLGVVACCCPSLVQVPAVTHYVKPAYWSGLPIVPVILLGYVFSGMYAVVTAGLYIERKTRVLPWIAGAGAVLNIAICIVAHVAVGDGRCRVGYAGGLRADGGARRVAVEPRVPGAVRVAPARAPRRHRRRCSSPRTAGSPRVACPPLSSVGLLAKAAILLGLPVLLFATRFFRHGELQVLRGLCCRARAAPLLLSPRKHVLPARVALPHRRDLAVLHVEAHDGIGELRQPELARTPRLQLHVRAARQHEPHARPIDHLHRRRPTAPCTMPAYWRSVRLRRERRRHAALERHRGLVERHLRAVHLAHRVGAEVHRPLAVLLVVGRVEAVVVEVRQRQLDAVQVEARGPCRRARW